MNKPQLSGGGGVVKLQLKHKTEHSSLRSWGKLFFKKLEIQSAYIYWEIQETTSMLRAGCMFRKDLRRP